MSKIQETKTLPEILDGLSNPPHTFGVSQYKRGIGDVYPTYTAGFSVNTPLTDLGAAIADLITELAAEGIAVKKTEVEHLRVVGGEPIKNGLSDISATVTLELETPEQRARKFQLDTAFAAGVAEHFSSRKGGQN